MLVSWNWLKDYVPLAIPPAELVQRLAMAGLNHEETRTVGGDLAIDLEVTSNRPDCLGHLGVAREISVLCGTPLAIPSASPAAAAPDVQTVSSVRIDCPDLCSLYTARVIRGVRVGPSPPWLVERLATVGVATINNVADITNYVMLECGQPLHAFDFDHLQGRRIVVRAGRPGEPFVAIDHRPYTLDPGMCVIADAHNAVALGGVMGGAESEISTSTTSVLIEAAAFSPLSIRTTARKLSLYSPSSYRFERGVDLHGVDWASRRCCELILQLAGGELHAGVALDGARPAEREPIALRLDQIPRILGIDIPPRVVTGILQALGLEQQHASPERLVWIPPSWRRDLTREIDLIEEVARIHGYERIPDDIAVAMTPSHRTDSDRIQQRIRQTVTAAGFDEAMTVTIVPADWSEAFSPWTQEPSLQTNAPMLKGADRVRCSLVPSLLDACRWNQSMANPVIELFEMARIYLPQRGTLPREQWTLALVSGGDYYRVKGVAEGLLEGLQCGLRLEAEPFSHPLLDRVRCSQLSLSGERLGFLGELAAEARKTYGLRGNITIAELNLDLLARHANLLPRCQTQSTFPAISRDLNLIVPESVRWADLEATARCAAGECLEWLTFREVYRDPQKDGPNRKRLLFSFSLRASDRTLTSEEADALRDRVVVSCRTHHQAELLA